MERRERNQKQGEEEEAESAQNMGPHLLSPPQRKHKRLEENQNTKILLFSFSRRCVGFCHTTKQSAKIVHPPPSIPLMVGQAETLMSPLLCTRQNTKKQRGTRNN